MGRILLGFLSGLICGFLVTVYFLHRGGGDYFIAASPRVQQLELSLQRAAQEQEHTTRKLEEAAAAVERLSARFTDLERRLQDATTPPPAPPQPPVPRQPEEPAPSGGQLSPQPGAPPQ